MPLLCQEFQGEPHASLIWDRELQLPGQRQTGASPGHKHNYSTEDERWCCLIRYNCRERCFVFRGHTAASCDSAEGSTYDTGKQPCHARSMVTLHTLQNDMADVKFGGHVAASCK